MKIKKIFEVISKNKNVNLFFYLIGRIFLFKKEVLQSKWVAFNYAGYYWLIRAIWFQRILGFNRFSGYFVNPSTIIAGEKNIKIHPNSIDAFTSPGCYFQSFDAKIYIEENVLIAPNVGLITSNHNPYDTAQHMQGRDIVIKKNCWIGMNSVILPGVELGEGTVVAAGSVVTKSFPQGRVMLAGAPACIRKILE